MIVKQILGSKGSNEIFWVKPSDKVLDATRIMSENRIGTVVVSEDGVALTGILSERDIVRELGKHGSECLDGAVSELMTAEIITCVESDSADSILVKMTEGRFRHIPVMKDDRMLGLISIGDVVKARLSQLSMEKDALEGMIKGY